MQRLVYTPKVEVLIMLEQESRLVDVTEDIVSGSVNRRLNAMSDMQLVLQNKNGRYTKTHRIEPMDRIIVRMSRVGKPMLVFSGFVDDAPYYQLYPGTVTLAASDTLKLLQHTYFDPGLPAVQGWFISKGWQYNPDTGALFVGPGGVGNDDLYGNMKDIIRDMLTDIANWPEQGITIYDLPANFLKSIEGVMQDASDAAKEIRDANLKILSKLYGTSDITGSSTDSSIVGDTGGLPSTGNIDIVDVARLALKVGFAGNNAVTAVAVARAESSFNTQAMNWNPDNITSGGGTWDVGLWQINSQHATPPANHLAGTPTSSLAGYKSVKSNYSISAVSYIESMWNPTTNATAAYSISAGGTTFTPWATYNNNLHLPYMTAAADAVNKAKITPTSPISIPATSTSTTTTSTSAANDSPQRQDPKQSVATSIVQIAEAESKKGITEIGNSNSGPEIQKYQAVTGAFGLAWCASFAQWVYKQAGRPLTETDLSASVGQISTVASRLKWTVTSPSPGDLILWGEDHVGIVTSVKGSQVWTVEGNTSNGVYARGPYTIGSPGLDGDIPSFVHPTGLGAPGASYEGTSSVGGQDVGSFSKAQIERLGAAGSFFTQQFQSSDMTLASMLTGERAIANDVPIMEWIDNVVPASGRVYCTTPAGSFLAFFPDRWGFFERTPYFHINDIEIIDLTINRNDTNLTTHVFTSGPLLPDAGIQNFDRMNSMVASIEDEAFKYFVNVDASFNRLDFLARYGARPYVNDMINVNNPLLLWMNGWMKFMELWAKRFTANASFTFMPELLPGGLVSFGNRVQMFVESTTHTFDMSGGFSTTAELSSLTALDTDQFSELTNTGGQLDPLVSKERFKLQNNTTKAP